MKNKDVNWPELIAEWKASGMSQREFGALRGVSGSMISYYLHGGYKGYKKSNRTPKPKPKSNGVDTFTRVGAPEQLEVTTKNGIKLSIPVTVTADQLRTILGALG